MIVSPLAPNAEFKFLTFKEGLKSWHACMVSSCNHPLLPDKPTSFHSLCKSPPIVKATEGLMWQRFSHSIISIIVINILLHLPLRPPTHTHIDTHRHTHTQSLKDLKLIKTLFLYMSTESLSCHWACEFECKTVGERTRHDGVCVSVCVCALMLYCVLSVVMCIFSKGC